MPAFNAENYIGAAIESIQSQTFRDWELVIVDDGSLDGTLRVANEYARSDNRIRILKMDVPSHRALEPRRKAILEAKADWIAKLDADDILEPTALEKLISLQKKYDADLVLPTVYTFKEGVEPSLRLPKSKVFYDTPHKGRDLIKHTLLGWKFAASGGLTRKSLYLKVYDKYSYKDDYSVIDEICSRHLLLENPLTVFSKSKYFYRSNEFSISSERIGRIFDYTLVNIDLVHLTSWEFGTDSQEYFLAQKQNFYGIFDMYKRMNRFRYAPADIKRAHKMIAKAKKEIDWQCLENDVSPRYKFLLQMPGLPIRFLLKILRKK